MCDFFLPMIPQKRAGDGQDLFSLLCRATDEDGAGYTDQEIVDHMIFLMMAAHDTTTSTLTSMVYALAKNPEWQDRLRAEMDSLDMENLTTDTLNSTSEVDWVIKEAPAYVPAAVHPAQSEQYRVRI